MMGQRGLKQSIIQAGEVEKVDEVRRGALLGHSETEWMWRAREEQRLMERSNLITGVLHIGLGIFWAIFLLLMTEEGIAIGLVLPVLYSGLGAGQIIMYYDLTRRNRNPVAVPGLYEHGIQMPSHFFLPYPEIGRIERKPTRSRLLKKRDMIRLRGKYAKKPGSLTDGWFISADFLGPYGMLELKKRLEMDRGIRKARPALVLYGSGGIRSLEPGMGPARGTW
jgi:hypothetical protein